MPKFKENEITPAQFLKISFEKRCRDRSFSGLFGFMSRLLLSLLNAVATWYFFITKQSFKNFHVFSSLGAYFPMLDQSIFSVIDLVFKWACGFSFLTMLTFYFLQGVASHVAKARKESIKPELSDDEVALKSKCNEKSLKYLSDRELFYKVVAKQRKFFEAFGLSVFDKLDSKYAALSNEKLHVSSTQKKDLKENYINLAYNDGNLIEAHMHIQSLLRSLYLLQVRDSDITEKVKSGASFKFLNQSVDVYDLIINETSDFSREMYVEKVHGELRAFIERWRLLNPSQMFSWFAAQYPHGASTYGYFSSGDLLHKFGPAAVDSEAITANIQRELVGYFHVVLRKLSRLQHRQSSQVNYNQLEHVKKLTQMRDALAANFEHEVVKKFPVQQGWTSVIDKIISVMGYPNAFANGILFMVVCYPVLSSVFTVFWTNLFCFICFCSGVYTSAAITLENIKKFTKSFKTKGKTIFHHRNFRGFLNFIMGFAVGSCSGFFFYHSVSSLMRDPSGVFYRLLPDFYAQNVQWIVPSVVITFSIVLAVCAVLLYINMCLKSQRKDFDRDTFTMCKDKLVAFDWRLLMKPQQIVVLLAAAAQVFLAQHSLYSLSFFAGLGHFRLFFLMCAGVVWINIYKVNFHKMYTEGDAKSVAGYLFNPKCSSGLFLQVHASSEYGQQREEIIRGMNEKVNTTNTDADGSQTYRRGRSLSDIGEPPEVS